jgi:F-type H+-transporting ATPase subunit gamma
MANLKALRARITSVKNTRKITSAMKMVAASKLRRAQSQAEAARPYAERMERMLAALAANVVGSPTAPRMMVGTGKDQVHLILAMTADRGLAGAFNSNVGRATRNLARRLVAEGKTVKIFAVGRKGRDYLRRELSEHMIGDVNYVGRKSIGFADAHEIAERVAAMLNAGEFDVCTVVYNRFISVVSQEVTEMQLIPAAMPKGAEAPSGPQAQYEFEPDEESILARLLPQNLAIQIYRALLENNAGFQASQMTAMDNATRNAGEMINKLTLLYNRTRQANITSELIEIISGAEAI